jgi:4-hydroxythreonine-4-phosphate dehydrogenase
MKPIIAITIGDINGIGPEVINTTFADAGMLDLCTPIIYGHINVLEYYKTGRSETKMKVIKSYKDAQHGVVNVINCWEEAEIKMGEITEEAGKYAMLALEQAMDDMQDITIEALITAPINKKAMQLAGFGYPGHTEYLSEVTSAKEHMMLMVSNEIRVGMVTGHIPLEEVSAQITKEKVLRRIYNMYDCLIKDFGIIRPKIAVLGLNPHAGDNGALGNHETKFIMPAIQEARGKGVLVFGAFPADGFFGSEQPAKYDGILAMYHDQGLIPFKTMAFETGVNFTYGLPFVRTSPDHGTAFDIAGQNIANPESFRNAIFVALEVSKKKENYREMYANPLKPQKAEDFGMDEVVE